MPVLPARLSSKSRLRQYLALGCFAIALCLSLLLAPASLGSVPIRVDNQVIFQLSDSPELGAQERAQRLDQQIQAAVRRRTPASIEVNTRNQQPVLRINGRSVLTVLPSDTIEGNTPTEQAEIWAAQIKSAVEAARARRSSAYLRNAALLSLGLLVLAVLLHWGLGKIWPYPTRWLIRRIGDEAMAQSPPPGLQLAQHISLGVARLGVWGGVGLTIASLFPQSQNWSAIARTGLLNGLTQSFLTLGSQSYSLLDFLILLIMLLVLLLAIGAFVNFLKLRLLPQMGINRGAAEVITVITRYVMITLGAIVLLQIWGLNLSSLTIVGSALGVGVGFGLQGIAKNLISGLVLLFERSVQVGDLIEVGDYVGVVERVSARNLIVKTLDRVSVIVPSSKVLEDIVVNWSHDSLTSRLHLPIGVAYGSELEKVKTLLLQAAQEHPQVLKAPLPAVVFVGFGDSSLDFELLIWIKEPSRQLFIRSDLYFRIDALFREHGIEIPFPQRDLHLRSGQWSRGDRPQAQNG
ncbi:mechanosensitive ion channel family protein [Lyngbya confervoides]|uniref:Mechanosensitive ion channel n=1 Tax=Lyngbya confervoides BDU141951 TaxID=1574623 RepID=A0ABD4T562_9CYAN|nr:mechanosensitive ion channel domain-containing protein [Lyngbya confervoides]MCM1983500.1 mechanosensitive ion channel [Lyngbya confervoides BDU141951]